MWSLLPATIAPSEYTGHLDSMDGIVGLHRVCGGNDRRREHSQGYPGAPDWEAIDPEIYDKISSFVESFDGIVGSHDLIVHNYGPSQAWHPFMQRCLMTATWSAHMKSLTRIEREAMRADGNSAGYPYGPGGDHDERVVEFKELVTSVLDLE